MVLLGVGPATAQGPPHDCFPAREVEWALFRNYGERLVLRLLTDSGDMLLMFSDGEFDDEGSSWTVLHVRGDGMLCQVNSGTFWERISRRAPRQEIET